jgi:hypothetical protein
MHFGARWYDPSIQRCTHDMLAELKQANRYAYAGDHPVDAAGVGGG